MSDSEDYIKGPSTAIETNRGNTIVITPCYPKKEPEGLWEDVYRALIYIGVLD